MTTPELTTGLPLLRELLLFCAIAGILIPLGRRLHFSQVLVFLIVGAAIGPHGLGSLVGDRKSTRLNSSHPSLSRMPSSA